MPTCVAGRSPDPALGKAAKQRSLHNNYMTLPVLFIMISHHYPMTYGAQRPWLVLALIGLTGVAVRHVFNLRHRNRATGRTIALAVVLALATVTYVTMEKTKAASSRTRPVADARPGYAAIAPILAKHCTTCHSLSPTDRAVTAPPLGLVLTSYGQTRAAAPRIKKVAVDSEIMPLGNLTGMTLAERQALGRWIAEGAPQ